MTIRYTVDAKALRDWSQTVAKDRRRSFRPQVDVSGDADGLTFTATDKGGKKATLRLDAHPIDAAEAEAEEMLS